MSEIDDVRAFNAKFGLLLHETPGHLTYSKLLERAEFMGEELCEFYRAAHEQDLASQADALVDLVYVALGTAVMLGLPWAELWADVQRANMAKVRGPTKRGHAVDCCKPEGWVGPKTTEILEAHGYTWERWNESARQGNAAAFRDDIEAERTHLDEMSARDALLDVANLVDSI